MPNIMESLTRLGLSFKVWNYDEADPRGGGGPMRQATSQQHGIPESKIARTAGMPRIAGIAYLRNDASGHVVICKFVHRRLSLRLTLSRG